MNYAVAKVGAGQTILEPGKTYTLRGIASTSDKVLKLDKVLMVVDGRKVVFGTPVISKASVDLKILSQEKGDKVTVFKYKPKVRYRRKIGYRDILTKVTVEKINLV